MSAWAMVCGPCVPSQLRRAGVIVFQLAPQKMVSDGLYSPESSPAAPVIS